jgi:hypothetical protein
VKKSDREIMEILEAYDATGVAHSAAELCDADPKTVRRYARARDAGRPVTARVQRPKLIDPFLEKIEEWVERSEGKVRADIVHDRLAGMEFAGNERTTRRAVAAAKARWRAGHGRTYRPWITEPGLWLQWDWGKGPRVPCGPDGKLRDTLLFCVWLAWSRFRVVLPVWDRTLPTLIACLDTALRRIGGVPVYALTDNEKTVTTEHVAGVPVRHPEIVAVGRHYGMTVHTCVPYDPESKGGSESTVKIAKADLVPAEANLLEQYRSFAQLAAACDQFCDTVNGRVHRETCAVPAQRLLTEQTRLHRLPDAPHTAALGQTRVVNTDQTVIPAPTCPPVSVKGQRYLAGLTLPAAGAGNAREPSGWASQDPVRGSRGAVLPEGWLSAWKTSTIHRAKEVKGYWKGQVPLHPAGRLGDPVRDPVPCPASTGAREPVPWMFLAAALSEGLGGLLPRSGK